MPETTPVICTKARVHPAHGIYATPSSRPVEGSTIGAVIETQRLVGQCAGLDFDTWFERTQDALS